MQSNPRRAGVAATLAWPFLAVALALAAPSCSSETVLLVSVTGPALGAPIARFDVTITHVMTARPLLYMPVAPAPEILLPTSFTVTMTGVTSGAAVTVDITAVDAAGNDLAFGSGVAPALQTGRVNEVVVALFPAAECGNADAEPGEDCDGADIGGDDCTTVPGDFTGGTLGCTPACAFDTTACTTAPLTCGNGALDAGEDCDGTDLAAETCVSLGFVSGTLACAPDCTFDDDDCVVPANCGNGIIEPVQGEECEPGNVGAATCATIAMGFDGGALDCGGACLYDVTACTTCGDGAAEGTELCDGSDLGVNSCTTLGMGFTGGVLVCDAACAYDVSGCTAPATCGNAMPDPGEDCDGSAGGATCTSVLGPGTMGLVTCGAGCMYDLSGCYECGDGSIDAVEVCDGANLGIESCITQGFDSGVLLCGAGCTSFDTGACASCGNGMVEPGEPCDGTVPPASTCASFGYAEGTLACDAGCNLDTSACYPAPGAPTLRLPFNGAYNGSVYYAGGLTTTFTWEAASYSGPTTLTYEIMWDTDPTFGTPSSSTTSSLAWTLGDVDLPVSTLVPVGTVYYWRVRAFIASTMVYGPWSPYRYVNVGRSATDMNGDGYGDTAIAAPTVNLGAMTAAGRVLVFTGGSTVNVTSDLTISGSVMFGYLGSSVALADLNGDGFADLVVGQPSSGGSAGQVFIYLGASTLDSTVDVTLSGGPGGDQFGAAVARAGDVNADGFQDLIVGAFRSAFAAMDAGRAFVYLGGAPFDSTVDGTMTGTLSQQLGFAVAGAGDTNGDGYADVVVGAPGLMLSTFTGSVYVYRGAAGTTFDGTADTTLAGTGVDDAFGDTVSLGDREGNGFSDVFVGAPRNDLAGSNAGQYSWFAGSATGTSTSVTGSITGGAANDQFGNEIWSAGDVDRDGLDDLAVGAPDFNFCPPDEGVVNLYRGNTSLATMALLGAGGSFDRFGSALATTDFNADGYDDLFVGITGGGVGDVGTVQIYLGSSSFDATSDGTITGAGGTFGFAIAR